MSNEYLGIYRGVVVDNNDTLNKGRVTCKVPQVMANGVTPWCEPIYPTVYRPKAGDIVWVQFINGSLDTPIYFSSDAVTAEKIIADSITTEALAADAITAKHTITGARIQTGVGTESVIRLDNNQLLAYDPSGNVTVDVDGNTGNVTFVGTFGTANSGDPGVFLYKRGNPTYGVQPTVEFHTGAALAQPLINSATSPLKTGLFFHSGRDSSTDKQANLGLGVNNINLFVEATAGAGDQGALLHMDDSNITLTTNYAFSGNTLAAQLYGDSTRLSLLYHDSGFANQQGMKVLLGSDVNFYSSSGIFNFYTATGTAGAHTTLTAGSLSLTSDRSLKEKFAEAGDALEMIRNMPVYRYEFISDPGTVHIGPMADDAPDVAVSVLPDGLKSLSVLDQMGVLLAGLQQLDLQINPTARRKLPHYE